MQTSTTTAAAAQALGQWEGIGAGYPGFTVTAVPADPNMAVGPNHIVQWVNRNSTHFGDRLMLYRLAYRNFGDHESIVATHTVVGGAGNTGVRW